MSILAFNHYRQGYGLYLFSKDFYATTRTSTEGTSVVLKITDGAATVGGTCTAVVESVITGADAVDIPRRLFCAQRRRGLPLL